jgi:uncharacterized protein
MFPITKQVVISVSDYVSTSGILITPAAPARSKAVIIAHGAGNDMNEPCIAAFAENLSHAGYVTLRFNFLYREAGRKVPDKESALEAAWLGAYNFINRMPDITVNEIAGAGKSMGGRIASQMVAQELLPVTRLIFLGYPLHSPANQNVLRDAHLYRIHTPMLFFAGTRDRLCNLDRLKGVLSRIQADWRLSVVEGGDHSFRVPKSLGIAQNTVYKNLADQTIRWLDEQY